VKFRALLCGHRAGDPAVATLVLAAAAAFNGLLHNGEPMPNAFGHAPSLREIARELGMHVGSVRRGAQHLACAGAVRLDGGVIVQPEALYARWQNPRQRIRVTADMRSLRMRAEPLLLSALVAGQVDRGGRLCLGRGFLAERTGFALRTLDRAMATAEAAGAIHRWTAKLRHWQLFLAVGPSRTGNRERARTGEREKAPPPASKPAAPCEVSPDSQPSRSGEDHRREQAKTPSCSGEDPVAKRRKTSGLPSGCPPDQPPDARCARDVEPAAESEGEQNPAAAPLSAAQNPAVTPLPVTGVPAVVEPWVLQMTNRGIERIDPANDSHALAVASLLEVLPNSAPVDIANDPAQARRLRGLARERIDLARQVCRWARSPERLARWLVRASRWFGVTNLGAYLRRACAKGDPGTVLEGGTRDRVGGAVETWTDFSQRVEGALEGEHLDDVQRLVEGGADVMAEVDPVRREKLRGDLRKFLAVNRRVSARAVLLQLVGPNPSDAVLERDVADILAITEARRLLAA